MTPFVSMRYDDGARQLAACARCAASRVMMRSTGWDSTSASCSMSLVRSPAVSTPCNRPLAVRDDHDAALLGQHDDRLPQRTSPAAARAADRVSITSSTRVTQPTTERTAGMQPREVLAAKSLVLEQRHGERVAERERDRGARRRREIVRTRLLAHPRIERHVAQPRERRARLAR